jgi:hypothetical protein
VPSLAELEYLRRHPQPAYAGYPALRAQAAASCPRFVDPAAIGGHRALIARRGADWCTAVLGYPFPGYGPGGVSVLEMHLLVLADRAGLDPPLPEVVARWRAEDAEARAAREHARRTAAARDADDWQRARAGCPVPVRVVAAAGGRRTNHPGREPLRHVVPDLAAHSGPGNRPRLHRAGRPLCETPGRARPLRLADQPTDQPATCVRCLTYTPTIRPAEGAIDDRHF